jgi:flagellin FlaB
MNGDTRGQSGLDRLMLFVVFIVAVVAVTPLIFGLGGVDLRPGTESAEQTPTPTPDVEPTDPGVVVLGATGETGGFGNDTVGIVRVVVTKNGTGPAVDTSSITASWVGPDRGYALSAAGSGAGGDGEFAVTVTGPSDSETLLNQSGDRAILTFDVGTDDVDGIGEFSRRLESGDTVTLELTTDSGVTERVTLTVPGSLATKSSVRL